MKVLDHHIVYNLYNKPSVFIRNYYLENNAWLWKKHKMPRQTANQSMTRRIEVLDSVIIKELFNV